MPMFAGDSFHAFTFIFAGLIGNSPTPKHLRHGFEKGLCVYLEDIVPHNNQGKEWRSEGLGVGYF